jgi:hypothetical protein
MKNDTNENKALSQTSVMVSADLYDEVFSFIDCIRAITMNKQTYDEALQILKKLADAKV